MGQDTLVNTLNTVSMSWVTRQQAGVWSHDYINKNSGRDYVMLDTVGKYVRDLRIAIMDTKLPFKASLEQSSIPYWEQPESVNHVWRTPFLITRSESQNLCFITVQFSAGERGGSSRYVVEWEESYDCPANAIKLTKDNYNLPEPVAARL